MGRRKERLEDRLLRRIYIDPNTGCWLWLGRIHRSGYGQITVDGKTKCAHVVSYETFVGPVPEGLQLDHLCRTRPCINPSDLEPVTGSENVRTGIIGSRTHCPRNHEYSKENTYVNLAGHRACRRCHSDRENNRQKEKRRCQLEL